MREREKRAWLCVLVMTGVLGYYGSMPAHAAESTEMPSDSVAPPTTQTTVSPDAPTPQGQGKGTHRKEALHRMKEACGEDIKKLCQNVKRGEGRIVQCLEQHQAEVAPNCNQLLQKKKSRQGQGH